MKLKKGWENKMPKKRKLKIGIDFDGCIFDDKASICRQHNQIYKTEFKKEDLIGANKYADIFKIDDCDIANYFCSKKMYSYEDLFIEHSPIHLNYLNQFHDTFIVSVGINKNNMRKLESIEKFMPNIESIMISFSEKVRKDKSMIRGFDVFVDDSKKVLRSVDAEYKILFRPDGLLDGEDIFEMETEDNFILCWSWSHIMEEIRRLER
jgi:hypothetical protein